jgi:hypothetical protein
MLIVIVSDLMEKRFSFLIPGKLFFGEKNFFFIVIVVKINSNCGFIINFLFEKAKKLEFHFCSGKLLMEIFNENVGKIIVIFGIFQHLIFFNFFIQHKFKYEFSLIELFFGIIWEKIIIKKTRIIILRELFWSDLNKSYDTNQTPSLSIKPNKIFVYQRSIN